MNYEQARVLIHDGDAVFVRDVPSLAATTIRGATDGPESHCAFAFWIEQGDGRRLMCSESVPGAGVRVVNLSIYARYNLDVVCAPRPWKQIAATALEMAGVENYGYRDLIVIGLRERFGINLGDPKGVCCSEYMSKVWWHHGLRVTRSPSPHRLRTDLTELRGIKLRCEIRV